MTSDFLREIILIITAAFVGGFLARLIFLPPVLGYILSGVLFGSIGANIFESQNLLLKLSELGVALLLFTLGFEVSLDSLKKIDKKIIIIGLLQVIITALILSALFLLFRFSLQVSILFSILLAFSSTAVVVKLLQEKGLINDFPGNVVFVILLIQDLFIIPIIYFMPILFSGVGIEAADILIFLFDIVKTLVIFLVMFALSKYFFPRLMNLLFRYPSHEFNLLATIFIATLAITILTGVGVPQTIAAFLAGLLISDEGKNLAPLSEIRPIRDIFLVLFFVMTGMMINIEYLISNIGIILFLGLFIILIKFTIMYFSLRFFRYVPSSAVFIGVYLSNIGEFSAIIGQIAYSQKYINQNEYNFLLTVFILSLLLVPFWIKYFRIYAERIGNLYILRRVFGFQADISTHETQKKYSNHVLLCGHGRVGKQIRTLLELASIPYVVVDFNQKVIQELLTQSKNALYGDPTDHEILDYANIKEAKVIILAIPDKVSQRKIIQSALKKNPNLMILVRSHNEEDTSELFNLGVNSIIYPEFEAGLKIGREVLDIFGIDPSLTRDYVKRIRRDNVV